LLVGRPRVLVGKCYANDASEVEITILKIQGDEVVIQIKGATKTFAHTMQMGIHTLSLSIHQEKATVFPYTTKEPE